MAFNGPDDELSPLQQRLENWIARNPKWEPAIDWCGWCSAEGGWMGPTEDGERIIEEFLEEFLDDIRDELDRYLFDRGPWVNTVEWVQ